MRLLLDTCVWGGARQVFMAAGHDVVWTGEWAEDPGDEAILAHAFQERRTLITLDKDFGELAVVFRAPHCGIVRLVNIAARDQGPFCLRILERYGDTLIRGALITAEWDRLRIRAEIKSPVDQ